MIGGEIADGVGSGPFAGSRSETASVGILVGFVIASVGVIIGALFWIVGVLYMAQAQKLKASLDGAVNSSPFLTNLDRAEMMSLPVDGKEKKTSTHTNTNVEIAAHSLIHSESVRAAAAYAAGILIPLPSVLGFSMTLGLVTFLAILILLVMSASERGLARFHSYQSVFLNAGMLAILYVSFFIGFIGSGFVLLLLAACVVVSCLFAWRAYNGSEFKILIIGDLARAFSGRTVSDFSF
jgi:uncharacterized membrane protein